MMRIDDSRIPKGGSVKVRCPHCREIEEVAHPASSDQAIVSPGPESGPGQPAALVEAGGLDAIGSETSSGAPHGPTEPTIPTDAFQNFRFPAETDATTIKSKWFPGGTRQILFWVVISVAVVALFALFVNVLLPGPMGTRPWGVDPMGKGSPPAMQYAPDVGKDHGPVVPPARR